MSAFNTPTSRPRQWSSPALGHKAALSATSTPLLDNIQGNDDEQEKRQRRRSRVIDLHGVTDSSINEAGSHSTAGTPAVVPKLSSAQISEHYSTCIKLSTENKITTKNAFGLHLIDYMADILKQKDSELNFKVAAGTLDASTKIYAVRVDAVHADAYRVLGGLGSETKPKESQDGEEEAEVAEGGQGEQVAAKQTKKRPQKKTVEQNLSNINLPESEIKCEVDPMFQRMAASFDENSTAGVFLSVLFSEDSRCELRFPSHMTLLKSQLPPVQVPHQHVPASQFIGHLKTLEDRPICPSLEDFSFTRWTPEHTTNLNQLLENMKQGEHAFDVNADIEPDEDVGPDFGDNFDVDVDEGRQGECEEFKEHREACSRSPQKGRGVIPIGKVDIATMCLQLSDQPREYSYFSPRTMATWVGPGYWLFKPGHKQDHKPDKEPRKRAPKNPLVIDFKGDINFHNYFRTTRAATTISKSALNTSNKKTTLPADFQYPPSNLSQLSLKPSNTLSAEGKKRSSGELGEDIGEYDYNNANDTANFCPGLQEGDSEDAEGFGGSDDSQTDRPTPFPLDTDDISTYGEDCLVPEPHKVNTIEINYAKTAKKMDMKKLKTTMWGLLTESPEKPAKQVDSEETTEVPGEKSFSQSVRNLLQRLPSTMATNLSVPLAFVALLHLANEKNLELHKIDGMTDIIIKQGH
ncbi:condensin complex subunit 2 isoform X1 [Sinocyclocheilus anshuiensis]|uniref:Condensin complex subunit 2 n=1 Tax=Sinocyclocheilus anshuiensis TaxID=1608454 RepID=A0A671Q7C6_9TELE|nr:PREDICTED: condensin complex subunit 2-like isoform X1 [Sinocyclocheilus anshuiensis]XP_016322525.1 PREDICTED: condensin complex subunit 2-like isoform X1 [Sinocyclocheilus anshuiensis]